MANNLYYPTVYVDKITLETASEGGIEVNVSLKMKISSDEEEFLSKLQFADTANDILDTIRDTAKVNVMSVSDENLFKMLRLSKELVHAAAFNRLEHINYPRFIQKSMQNLGIINIDIFEEEQETIKQEISRRVKERISIKEIRNFSTSMDWNELKENLETGEIALNVYFKTKINIPQRPEHLSLFVVTDYSDNASSTVEMEMVKTSAELVYNDNKIVSHTYAFYQMDGKIWTGSVFKDPLGIWRKGRLADWGQVTSVAPNPPEEVTQRTFYNTKIQDFTSSDSIDFLPVNDKSKYLESIILKDFETVVKKTYVPEIKQSPVIFNGSHGDGVSFNIMKKRLLKKHSRFYNFLESVGAATQINNNDWIKEVKVYKKRVSKTNIKSKIGEGTAERNLNNEVPDFSKNEKKIYLTEVTVKNSTLNIPYIRYKVKDDTIMTKIDGDYCYGIEIKFEDPYSEIFKMNLKKLKRYLSIWMLYFNEINVVGYKRQDGFYVDGNYDERKDKTTEKFYRRWSDGRLNQARAVFLESFYNISKIMTEQEKQNIESKIMNMTTSRKTTPNYLLIYLRLYNDLIYRYEKIIKDSYSVVDYEENIYFNKEKHVVVGSLERIIGEDTGPLARNRLQQYYKDLNLFSSRMNVTIEKNEENISNMNTVNSTYTPTSEEYIYIGENAGAVNIDDDNLATIVYDDYNNTGDNTIDYGGVDSVTVDQEEEMLVVGSGGSSISDFEKSDDTSIILAPSEEDNSNVVISEDEIYDI